MSRLITLKSVHYKMNQEDVPYPATTLRMEVFKGKFLFELFPSLSSNYRRHLVHSFSKLYVILSSLDVIEPNHEIAGF